MSEMDVWGSGIYAELDAEWAAESELFEQFLFGKDFCCASGQLGELLFGRHEEGILKCLDTEIGLLRYSSSGLTPLVFSMSLRRMIARSARSMALSLSDVETMFCKIAYDHGAGLILARPRISLSNSSWVLD